MRERKKFLKLRTLDLNSPRIAKMNWEYGQQTVIECKKHIDALQQKIRRLQKEVESFKDLHHLEEQKQISATTADALLVGFD